MQRLPDSTRSLYAELFELTLQAEVDRLELGGTTGSFVSKEIRGRRYWYHQRIEGSEKRQRYLGPESPALLAWLERAREARADAARRAALCAMLAAGGASRESQAVTATLEVLADGGLFRVGGVLVGTVAYAALGTMLGVRWPAGAMRTEDIDVAQDPLLAVLLAPDASRAELERSLVESPLGYLPVPGLDPREPSTSFRIRGRQLRVDFLTPARGSRRSAPLRLRGLGVAAQPLPMLDILIEGSVQAVVVGTSGVLVNVPDPARYAFHKLWLAGQRSVSLQAKSAKDVTQADALLEALVAERPGDLEAAWPALASRPGVARSVRTAARRLSEASRAVLLGVIGS